MAVLKLSTPGVYVQEIPSLPPSVAEVATAIPAFIGYTAQANRFAVGDLKMIPLKIEGMSDYQLYFGGPPLESNDSVSIAVKDYGSNNYDVTITQDPAKKSNYNMYYALQHFYDNGGGTCYIISVGVYGAAPGTVKQADLNSGLTLAQDIGDVTLLCIPEAPVSDNYASLVQAMITQASNLEDRFALIDPMKVTPKIATNPLGDIEGDVLLIRNATLAVEQNRYSAAYYPNLTTTYAYNFDFDNLTIASHTPVGIPAPPVPDYTGKKLSDVGSGSVLYAKIQIAITGVNVVLPPSPAMAGLYTRVDNTKGVWKAPANEPVLSVVSPSIPVSSREQEDLNIDPASGKSINVIRTFPGYGTLVWGARTLNGNDNEWRYISVRRFFNMVEQSIKNSSQWVVFEPNTIATWVRVQAMIENYLYQKWSDGALAGVKPEQAYYVNIGLGTTMNAVDILEGRMNIEIGMAVARPAEFVILKFTQMMQQS
ncbi:MAG TPA: phage tail sheath C-terminal domain-containing protein [Chitinophagaceae bacterium]|jgi:hypothetical protein